MDAQIFAAFDEWARLESIHYNLKMKRKARETALAAVSTKAVEILGMRARTKDGALMQLRFCATFLELNAAGGNLAVGAIRNAINILAWSTCSGLSETTIDYDDQRALT